MSVPPSVNPADCFEGYPEVDPPELDYAFTTPEFMDEYDAYVRLAMAARGIGPAAAPAGRDCF